MYTIELTREEAIALRFMLGGAGHTPGLSPPRKMAAQEVLTKVDAALAQPQVDAEPPAATE